MMHGPTNIKMYWYLMCGFDVCEKFNIITRFSSVAGSEFRAGRGNSVFNNHPRCRQHQPYCCIYDRNSSVSTRHGRFRL